MAEERVELIAEGDMQDAIRELEGVDRVLQRVEKQSYEAARGLDALDVDLEDDIRQVQRLERALAEMNRELMKSMGLKFFPGGAGGGGSWMNPVRQIGPGPTIMGSASTPSYVRGVSGTYPDVVVERVVRDTVERHNRSFLNSVIGGIAGGMAASIGRGRGFFGGLGGGDGGGGGGGGGRGGIGGFFSYGSNDASLQAGDLFRGLLPGGARQSVGAVGLIGAGALGLGAAAAPAAGLGALGGAGALGALGANIATISLAMRGLGDALGGDKEAFDELTPSAQKFVQEMRSFIPYVDHLQQVVGEGGIWDGMADGLNNLLSSGMMENLEGGLRAIAETLGDELAVSGTFLGSPEMAERFGNFLQGSTKWTKDFGEATRDLFDALTLVLDAGQPYIDWMTQGINDGGEWVKTMTDQAVATGDFVDFMERGQDAVRAFGDFLGSLIDVLIALGGALDGPALHGLELVGDMFDELARTVDDNQERIEEFVNGGIDALANAIEALWPWIEKLIGGLDQVAQLMGGWENAFELILTGLLAKKVFDLVASFDALALGTGGGAIGRATAQAGLFSAAITAIPKLIRVGIALEVLSIATGGKVDPIQWAWDAGASAGGFVYDNFTSKLPFDLAGDQGNQPPGASAPAGDQSPLWGKTDKWLSNPKARFRKMPNGDVTVVGPDGTVWHTYRSSDTSLSAKAARQRASVGNQAAAAAAWSSGRSDTGKESSRIKDLMGGVSLTGDTDAGASALAFAKAVGAISGSSSIHISSGFRSKAENTATGGSKTSEHMSGNAVDIPAYGDRLIELGQAALIAAGMPAEMARKERGGLYNVNGYQIIFNTNEGGNHFDHLHVGVGRASGQIRLPDGATIPAFTSPASTTPPAWEVDADTSTPKDPPSGTELLTNAERLALARTDRTADTFDDVRAREAIIERLTGLSKRKKGKAKVYVEELITDLMKEIDRILTGVDTSWSDAAYGAYEDSLDNLAEEAKDLYDKVMAQQKKLEDDFTDSWKKMGDAALDAFDEITDSFVSQYRLTAESEAAAHEEAGLQRQLEDAMKDLEEAKRGKETTTSNADEILRRIGETVSRYSMANEIDKVQAAVLGIKHVDAFDEQFARTIGNLARAQTTVTTRVVDQEEIKRAEERISDIRFTMRQRELLKLADAEEKDWADRRERERKELEASLERWQAYYLRLVLMRKMTPEDAVIAATSKVNEESGFYGPPGDGTVIQDPFEGIRFFAEGGIATRPTLGVFAERGAEAVIPLSDPRARQLMGGNVNVIIEGGEAMAWLRGFIRTEAVGASRAISRAQGEEIDRRRRGGVF